MAGPRMKIAILGAGAWGTALAVAVSARQDVRHQVSLWGRDAAQMAAMRIQHVNQRYLPSVPLPDALDLRDWSGTSSWSDQDLLVVATPMAALRAVLTQIASLKIPVAWLCKGIESAPVNYPGAAANTQGLMAHEVLLQVAPQLQAGVLSGPSFAQEVALGQPTALVAASASPAVRSNLVRAFHAGNLRVYSSDDLVGVEVGGAVKNVLAIATGLCDGLKLGLNARAALITRGLHEMTRLGVALGARAETFMGLGGLGDLVLTATGDLSRNRRVGLALAQGQDLVQALHSLGHVAEGAFCARAVVRRAQQLGVDMPICSAVDALLDGRLDARQAVAALLARQPRDE